MEDGILFLGFSEGSEPFKLRTLDFIAEKLDEKTTEFQALVEDGRKLCCFSSLSLALSGLLLFAIYNWIPQSEYVKPSSKQQPEGISGEKGL